MSSIWYTSTESVRPRGCVGSRELAFDKLIAELDVAILPATLTSTLDRLWNIMPPSVNLAGFVIAQVKIERRLGKNKYGQTLWQGTCELCQATVMKSVAELRGFQRRGSTNACGCIARQGIVGQTFGLITVTRRAGTRLLPSGQKVYMYEGLCSCGTPVRRTYTNMTNSFACRTCVANSRTINLAKRTFGRLYVVHRAGSNKHGKATWVCRCACRKRNPNYRTVSSQELLRGETRSCGCWHDESASIRAVARIRNSRYAEWDCPFFRGRKKAWDMKRTWEVMFGRWLDLKGWAWRYEPQSFKLPSGRRYIPDFEVQCRVGTVYFDVKGWKKPDSMSKIKQFSRSHRIIVIDREELLRLTGVQPEHFKKLYDARDPWAYRGTGLHSWQTRLVPTGLY